MFFLSDSERQHLRELLQEKADECDPVAGCNPAMGLDERHIESDTHLVFEGLHVLANGHAARLYALLHPYGHQSHPEANGGRTLLMMQRIEEYGSAGCAPAGLRHAENCK